MTDTAPEGRTPEQPVVREVVLDVTLAASRSIDRIEVRRIRIAPNVALGAHTHNGPVVGSILEGTAIFQVAGSPQCVLRAGDVFFEPEGETIEHFDGGPDGVTFLGCFLVGGGEVPELTFV